MFCSDKICVWKIVSKKPTSHSSKMDLVLSNYYRKSKNISIFSKTLLPLDLVKKLSDYSVYVVIFDLHTGNIIRTEYPHFQRINFHNHLPRHCMCSKPIGFGQKVIFKIKSNVKTNTGLFFGYTDNLSTSNVYKGNDWVLMKHGNPLTPTNVMNFERKVCFV